MNFGDLIFIKGKATSSSESITYKSSRFESLTELTSSIFFSSSQHFIRREDTHFKGLSQNTESFSSGSLESNFLEEG